MAGLNSLFTRIAGLLGPPRDGRQRLFFFFFSPFLFLHFCLSDARWNSCESAGQGDAQPTGAAPAWTSPAGPSWLQGGRGKNPRKFAPYSSSRKSSPAGVRTIHHTAAPRTLGGSSGGRTLSILSTPAPIQLWASGRPLRADPRSKTPGPYKQETWPGGVSALTPDPYFRHAAGRAERAPLSHRREV